MCLYVGTVIYLVSIVHALTCLFIVIFILLQDPKGGVLGSLGGGGASKSFFGAEGASPFLVNVTKWLAIIFACTSFYLSYVSSQKDSSLMAPDLTEEMEVPLYRRTRERTKAMRAAAKTLLPQMKAMAQVLTKKAAAVKVLVKKAARVKVLAKKAVMAKATKVVKL